MHQLVLRGNTLTNSKFFKMKKVIAILAIVAFASCGGSTDATAVDTTAASVDTTATVDTTKADTTVVADTAVKAVDTAAKK